MKKILKKIRRWIVHVLINSDAFLDERHVQSIYERLLRLEENVTMNNKYLEENRKCLEDNKKELFEANTREEILRKQIIYTTEISKKNEEALKKFQNQVDYSTRVVQEDNAYESIDYFDFENHFRGSREAIIENQAHYLRFFQGCSDVIDIGCGRGEFLELLKRNHIHAIGVDTYIPFVKYCTEQGLNVINMDGNQYLEQVEQVDGIFVGQVVEHMPVEAIIKLAKLAYEKLKPGSFIIAETPNPTSLAIFTNAFYMDPSHEKPVHPLTLKYIFEKAGFQKVEFIYGSKLPVEIPELKGNQVENLEEFNEGIKKIADTLYGYQDYSIIATR